MAKSTGNLAYYIPDDSKYPVLTALTSGIMLFGMGLAIVWGNTLGTLMLVAGFLGLVATVFRWFSTVIAENFAGKNNAQLKKSYVWGMSWFILSEVMFFAGFFGALFYVRVFAVEWLGGGGDKGAIGQIFPNFTDTWPVLINPDPEAFVGPNSHMSWPGFSNLLGWLPLWNTVILVTSSFTLTIAHHGLLESNRRKLNIWLTITLVLAVAFLVLQAEEYLHAYEELGLTLASGIYGSTFFILTGFHGAHVTLGSIMLLVMLLRSLKGHFKPDDHFGFEAAAWYWHFVDVVWVMLFLFVYIL